ncbi:MAG: hypothetical protein V5A68_06865 [Candidatus Thermoplasmatota archaeon]
MAKISKYVAVEGFLLEFYNANTRDTYSNALATFFQVIDENPDDYIKEVELLENKKRIKQLRE